MRRLLHMLLIAAVMLAAAGCGSERSAPPLDETSAAAELAFVTLPSILRLTPTMKVVDRDDAGVSIELTAARGEREGAQIVAWATEGKPRIVVETSGLRAKSGARIPAARVRAYIEQAMKVEHGSPAGRSGVYVDPLIPAADRAVVVSDSERLLAWIDIDVPAGAEPGSYVGSVRLVRASKNGMPLAGEDSVLARVPVRVRVRPTTLPHIPTLASHIGFDQSQLIRFEGVKANSDELREVTERYASELAAARLSIADVGVDVPGAMPGSAASPQDAAYLKRIFDQRGVASVRIPFYISHPFPDPLGRDRPAAVAYLRAAARWARQNGWGDRAYVFAIDEPDDAAAGDVRELHELVRDADPRLRLLVTREASAREFQGIVDIWSPNISPTRYRAADVKRELRAGRETWWYPSITTFQPHPTLFIDELRPTPRALGWLAWRDGVRGFLYWTATHWHEVEDPYRDPGTYNEPDVVGNGDGVLLYPGGPIGLPGTPVPSVRLFQLRDGIEDHDLLVQARCAATPDQQRRITAAVRAAVPAIDRIDPTSDQVEALRMAAFSAIERRGAPARCGNAGP
ncbi:MAG: DUF4091 domain-containing protein [Gaiellales bacterium]